MWCCTELLSPLLTSTRLERSNLFPQLHCLLETQESENTEPVLRVTMKLLLYMHIMSPTKMLQLFL
jgi:hypothetical protein